MSKLELEPLAHDIQGLVETGRSYHPAPGPAARARLEAWIMAPGPIGGVPTPAAVAAGTSVLAKPLVVGLAAFVLGLGGGAGLQAGLHRGGDARRPAPSRPAPAIAPGRPSSAPASAPVVQAPPPASAPCSCPTARAPAPTRGRDAELAAERALLETARTALGRRESAATLEILVRHERAFPQGRLAEEREAIAVQALLVEARYARVRARGARFLQRYPRSLFRPAVEDALRRAADVDPPGWGQ